MTATDDDTPAHPPIIRGESEVLVSGMGGYPRSTPCWSCGHARGQHRRVWWALLTRRPVCKGLRLYPAPPGSTCQPVGPCDCADWRANR